MAQTPIEMVQSIERITMFKVSEVEGQKKILDQYRVLMKTAVKVTSTNNFQRTEMCCSYELRF